MKNSNKILPYKKRKIKLHYDFLRKMLMHVGKIYMWRYDIFLRDPRIVVIIAMICFLVIMLLTFVPFLDNLYTDQLQEKITVLAYVLLSAGVIWQIGMFFVTERKVCALHRDNCNKTYTYQRINRQFMDIRRK